MTPSSSDLNPLDAGVLSQAEPKPKIIPEFKDAIQPEKAIDNGVKDYCKQLQAYVSASGGHFEHIMW